MSLPCNVHSGEKSFSCEYRSNVGPVPQRLLSMDVRRRDSPRAPSLQVRQVRSPEAPASLETFPRCCLPPYLPPVVAAAPRHRCGGRFATSVVGLRVVLPCVCVRVRVCLVCPPTCPPSGRGACPLRSCSLRGAFPSPLPDSAGSVRRKEGVAATG